LINVSSATETGADTTLRSAKANTNRTEKEVASKRILRLDM
jgi:hypothetical protein